ncbi:MAG: hypothetical protein CL678_15935 [Bdellovibrionaceae bacterium]|nr:hypothetical protein [Pseudobdellovibrionaceae bacterium]
MGTAKEMKKSLRTRTKESLIKHLYLVRDLEEKHGSDTCAELVGKLSICTRLFYEHKIVESHQQLERFYDDLDTFHKHHPD